MFGTIASYAKAPRKTYMLRHPVKSFQIMRTRRKVKDTVRSRRVAATLGAAVAAVPLIRWVRNRKRNGESS